MEGHVTDEMEGASPSALIWSGARAELGLERILPSPTRPEAIRAVEALERGDWRTARELAPQLGRPGGAVRLLALSMRERTVGLVAESWQTLMEAAAYPAGRGTSLHASAPGVHAKLAWPYRADSEFWCRFGLIGQREELEARSQWSRIEDSAYPKRTCLVESCVDHLTWIVFDRLAWRPRSADERLAVNDRVTMGKFGEAGREYFLRRANELFHFVCPFRGSLSRKVWEDLDAYCGLHDAAAAALAERDDVHDGRVGQRLAYIAAVSWARQAG